MSEARLRRATDALADMVADEGEPLDFHVGTATAITGSLVTYSDAQGATIPNIPCVGPLPVAGDLVLVLQRTPSRWVLGAVATA